MPADCYAMESMVHSKPNNDEPSSPNARGKRMGIRGITMLLATVVIVVLYVVQLTVESAGAGVAAARYVCVTVFAVAMIASRRWSAKQ